LGGFGIRHYAYGYGFLKRSWQQGNIEFSKFRIDADRHLTASVTAIDKALWQTDKFCFIAKIQQK